MNNIFAEILQTENSLQHVALCTVVKTTGSTPRKAGAKMLVYENGHTSGSIGGGKTEKLTIEKAISAIERNEVDLFQFKLNHENEMMCGGEMIIFIEPLQKQSKLYIFGGGHIGRNIAKIAAFVGFVVTIIDERDVKLDDAENAPISHLKLHYREAFDKLIFDENTYIVSASHSHDFDSDIIGFSAKQKTAYVGMIAGKRKIANISKHYIDNNILTANQIEKIKWPAGVSIECQTPEEISIAVVAELVDFRSKQNKSN